MLIVALTSSQKGTLIVHAKLLIRDYQNQFGLLRLTGKYNFQERIKLKYLKFEYISQSCGTNK